MLSVSHSLASCRPSITAASVARFTELVREIGTSPAPSSRKRKNAARKKLSRVIKEQRRYAKAARLRAIAMTLTYDGSTAFSPKHISSFLDYLRRALKRMGQVFTYAWVLEQASTRHYHLLLWLPRGYVIDPVRLAQWWPWGSTWIESCHCVGAWGRYMVKFNSVARLPKGARLYGYGGLDDAGKTAASRAGLPRWLLAFLTASHRASRCRGGGWVDTKTGAFYCSPYVWSPWGMMPIVIT